MLTTVKRELEIDSSMAFAIEIRIGRNQPLHGWFK